MDNKNQKKMYTLFIVIVAVLLVVSAIVGAAIAISFNGKEEPASAQQPVISGDVVSPDLNVDVPTSSTVPTSNAPTSTVDPSNNVPTAPADVDPATTLPEQPTTDSSANVGPYTVGDYYVAKTDGKNLRLRASASSEVDTGIEIPAKTKLNITQIIASDDPAYPYWGATTYRNTAGYVAMQFLTDAATYEASNPNPTPDEDVTDAPTTNINIDAVVGNYSAGSYTVATGGYGGVKVKTEPGAGDGLAILADGEVVDVLDIQVNAAATAEDTVYWGHIVWQGWDAYVPMYYLVKNG